MNRETEMKDNHTPGEWKIVFQLLCGYFALLFFAGSLGSYLAGNHLSSLSGSALAFILIYIANLAKRKGELS